MGYFGRNSKQHAADLERDKAMHERTRQEALADQARNNRHNHNDQARLDDKHSSLEAGAHDGHLNEDTGSEREADREAKMHEEAQAENRRGVDFTIDPDAGLSEGERHARVR